MMRLTRNFSQLLDLPELRNPQGEVVDDEQARMIRTLASKMKAKGFNPYSLAQKAGVGQTYIRDILAGRSRNPRRINLEKIAKALGCAPDLLLPRSALTDV